MALVDTHFTTALSFGKVLSAPFRAIGRFYISLLESNSRIQLVDRLNAMSDAQLATRGLKREDIVPHVFRDFMHL